MDRPQMAMASENLAVITPPFDTRHNFTLRVGIFPTGVLRMMVGGAMGIDKWGAIEKDPARGATFYRFQGIFSHKNSPPYSPKIQWSTYRRLLPISPYYTWRK